MRTLISIAAFMVVSMPAFAAPAFNVPEPESLALLAIGGVALWATKRRKK